MKVIEKISLTIFSMVILILSLVLSLVLFNWLSTSDIYYVIQFIKATPTATNITLGVLVILMLLSVKCIFFPSFAKEKAEKAEGILLENESGKLLISIETIENLVKGVVAGFTNVKNVNCRVKLDKSINNVTIDMNLVVAPDTVIKELSANLQGKIKEVIKTTTEIDVKSIDIKIKNIEAQKAV